MGDLGVVRRLRAIGAAVPHVVALVPEVGNQLLLKREPAVVGPDGDRSTGRRLLLLAVLLGDLVDDPPHHRPDLLLRRHAAPQFHVVGRYLPHSGPPFSAQEPARGPDAGAAAESRPISTPL